MLLLLMMMVMMVMSTSKDGRERMRTEFRLFLIDFFGEKGIYVSVSVSVLRKLERSKLMRKENPLKQNRRW